MPSKFKKAIGAVKDQTSISIAKVASNNSSNLEVAVLKATTHDDVPMEERHVAEILQLVSANKVNAAACARAIGKRIGRTRNWIVAIKSLMLVLRIFQDGDPYFPREVLHAMKRGAKILNLSSFRDDSNSSPWDYTAFIRTFALYLDERLDCFLTGKLQRRYKPTEKVPTHRRSKSRQANEPVHDMKPAMLLDKVSYWQRLLDRAVATRPTGAAKTNRLVQIALYAIVQETFDLYKDISDGLALLLDSFFHLQYNSCVNAFQACIKATKQFEELGTFYDLCKSIGVGRTSEYPSVQKISEELIETLQEFLKDQTSFPSTGKSPGRPQLLLPAPTFAGSVSRRRHESIPSCTQSEFSEAPTEWTVSEYGSQCASLEDLISATELTGASPSISIDLEAYSLADQFAKDSQREDALSANDDTGSTRSLPISNSIVDFVSFDEWPDDDDEDDEGEQQQAQPQQDQRQKQPQQQQPKTDEIFGWELALVEPGTKPAQPYDNGFDPFSNHEPGKQLAISDSKKGWELVLAESTTTTTLTTTTTTTTTLPQPVLTIDNLFQQNVPPRDLYYNPFLQDVNELTAIVPVANVSGGGGAAFPVVDGFSPAPTFQAAPTFSAQKPNNNENDPFETFQSGGGGQGGSGSMNQQELLQQQQLWLQQQNKIIAKHIM